jgi:hypothetical protein
LLTFSRLIQWYHSHADPIWLDSTFKQYFISQKGLGINSVQSLFPARLNMFDMVDAALTEIFEKADVSGNGKITLTDYENMCVVYGIEVSEEEMLKIQVHVGALYVSGLQPVVHIQHLIFTFYRT